MLKTITLLLSFGMIGNALAQRGKDNSYTVTAAGTQINAYTSVTANANVNATSITVASNTLTNGFFGTALAPGDLIMIIQMQGASMSIDVTPTASWGGHYTVANGYLWGDWGSVPDLWGAVTAYNNAGKYEMVEVRSVAGANTINLMCGLKNAYTASGHVQVIRVPRLVNLTLNANTSLVPSLWDGTTGGVVALEVNGNVTFNANSRISATGYGFRGGVCENFSAGSPPGGGASSGGYHGSDDAAAGAEKGEGIGGFYTEYDALYSRYCKSAPANGGGGGNNHNAGGGGGSNIGTGAYTGKGNPNPTYAAIWNLESAGFGASSSSGGGRGGYSYSTSNQNQGTTGPNNAAWAGDYRRSEGGLGGHTLAYDATRAFMGGGGGAGDQNTLQGGAGGRGGGLVFLTVYGTVSGTGTIEANGNNGLNSNPNNQTPGIGQKVGNDGAGGAGAGGGVVISNGTAIPGTVTISAIGGNGGNHNLSLGSFAASEADGPGGGGAGGMIAFSSGAPVQTVAGGAGGVTTSTQITDAPSFPPNGATAGASGMSGLAVPYFNITPNNVTVCTGQTANPSVTVTGTLPGTLIWYTTPFGNTSVGTGTSITTGALAGSVTYYVGVCPGTFRVPVTVTVGGPTISGTASITHVTCTTAGSITGLSASGGSGALTYQWNSVTTPNANLTNASAGSYTLVVTDGVGCSATSGPYTINSAGGPSINTTNMVVTPENCLGNNGSITGITATGTGLTISWSNGPATLNNTGLVSGNYTLTVTDINGCVATAGPINVGNIPGPVINESGIVLTNETCGLGNGSITGITASGTGLTYDWSGTSTPGTDYTNLSAGNYTLTVTNNLGCTATSGPHTIINAPGPVISTASMVISDEHCGNNNGSITGITVTGGSGALTYSWNSGAYSTLNISGLTAGNYTLVVNDANGCTSTTGPHAINDIAGPAVDATNMVITPETCLGNDGSITGITATGAGTLNYAWNLVPSASPDLTGENAGNYILTVTDAFGCFTASGPHAIPQTPGPSIDATGIVILNETCTAGNGEIYGISATGNGLTYEWNSVSSPGPSLTNASAGTYTLLVTDNIGCVASAGPYTITDAPGPVLSAANAVIADEHCDSDDGSITGITVSGGTGTINYSWNAGAYTTLDITGLSAGTYNLVATDANGCTATSGPHNVQNIAGPSINTTNMVITPESCAGGDGSITGITATGTGALTYEWNNAVSAGTDLTNVPAGNYTLEVSDAFGCTATSGPHAINGAVVMTLDSSNLVITPTGCAFGTGEIEGLQVTGGINPVVSWSNSQSTLDIQNLTANTYTITVTDDQNCTITANFVVAVTPSPVISTANMVVNGDHCGQSDGSITGITVSGGTAPYYPVWDSNATPSVDYGSAPSGNHTLVVTDANGCTDQITVNVPVIAGPSVNEANLAVTGATCGQDNGAISGLAATGNGPFTYTWDNSAATTISLSGLAPGSYALTVTDNFGCTFTTGVYTISAGSVPVADFTIDPSPTAPGDVVIFTDASSGGVVAWEWTIEGLPAGITPTVNHMFAIEGDYLVGLVVENADGCTDTVVKIVSVMSEIQIPNVITLNDDGKNDVFFIKNLKEDTELIILNRWGNLVFKTSDYLNDWDGTDLSGEPLSEGVYTYQLITPEGKVFQGFVHLLNQ